MTVRTLFPKRRSAWTEDLIDLIRDYYEGQAPRQAPNIDAALRDYGGGIRPGDVLAMTPDDGIPRRYLKHAFGFVRLKAARLPDGRTKYQPQIPFQKKAGPIWTVGGLE